jgi:hypothetical protein
MYNLLFVLPVKFFRLQNFFFFEIVTEIQGTTQEISADKCRRASIAVRQISKLI